MQEEFFFLTICILYINVNYSHPYRLFIAPDGACVSGIIHKTKPITMERWGGGIYIDCRCVCVCVHPCVYLYMIHCIHVRMYICMDVYTFVCVCVYVSI